MADDHKDVIAEAKRRLELSQASENEFREKFLADLRFVYEDSGQWDHSVLNAREAKGRPCYTFNRIEGAIDQVQGDQRQSRPSIKIRAAEGGDKDTAETLSGLIRNILNVSDFETTQDNAFLYQIAGGYGVWRVVHDFNADDSFEQDIEVREVHNPLTAYCDPAATDLCGRDARYWIISERVPKDEFENEFPEAAKVDFDNNNDDDWYGEDDVRVAEYYRKIKRPRTLLQLSNGVVTYQDEVSDILDELAEGGVTIAKSREVQATQVEWYKMNGLEVLEGPIVYDWKYIPVVRLYGKRVNIEGEWEIKGIVRNARDPQKNYNYTRSVMAEKALMAPKWAYVVTAKQIQGYEAQWQDPGRSEPYVLANSDPAAGGTPKPEPPSPVPVELLTLAQMDADDIKSTTGFFDASLGAQGNETSGKAILARQREGDVGSYIYVDNLAKAIKFTGEILVDMIPQIYDTERQVRVLGEDGKDQTVSINQTILDEETGQQVILNDMTQGKYDVAVTVGPSYSTLRQEAAERLVGLANADPALMPMVRDIIVKGLDIPESDELVTRLRKVGIQQGIIEPSDEEMENLPQPDPMQQQAQMLQFRTIVEELNKTMAETQKILAEAQSKSVETIETAAGIGITPEGVVAKVRDLRGD